MQFLGFDRRKLDRKKKKIFKLIRFIGSKRAVSCSAAQTNYLADQDDDGQAEKGREDKLPVMKPERRGRIHLHVHMVRSVEPPQKSDTVVRHVPKIHPDIEEHEDENPFRNCREREPADKQAPASYPRPIRSL